MSEATFLYRVQPTRLEMLTDAPTPTEAAVLEEHADYVEDLTAKRIAILAGRTLTADQHSFGIVIFRADTEEAARSIMNADPAVQQGIMRAELFPYRIAFMADQDQ